MKKFDIKDVFSWSNADQAKKYIGKQCYFADSLRYLKDSVNRDINYMLKEVFNNEKDQVQGVFRDVDGDFWGLCLPADKVIDIEEPKKYRPFKSVDEFINHLDFQSLMNNYIKVENKITSERYEFMIVGCFNNGLVLPLYGALIMDQLFEKFNICINGKWQPFGVEE